MQNVYHANDRVVLCDSSPKTPADPYVRALPHPSGQNPDGNWGELADYGKGGVVESQFAAV